MAGPMKIKTARSGVALVEGCKKLSPEIIRL